MLIAAMLVLPVAALWWWARRHRGMGSEADRATLRTLHEANRVARPLREGLTETSAERAVRSLRPLLTAPAVALSNGHAVLGWDGPGESHRDDVLTATASVLEDGRARVDRISCTDPACRLRDVISVPLVVGGSVVGTLHALVTVAGAPVIKATHEVADWVSGQLELAEVDRRRSGLAEAELRALRAQISPHFIYNALTTIAAFVRTDPDRARELLLEFADFTRYSFRRRGEYTALSDELQSIEQYLTLERARFGDRLRVTLRIAPDCLTVMVPYLSLQPVVENAVRHGLEPKSGPGEVIVEAVPDGVDIRISVEDNGVGEDPRRIQEALDGVAQADSVGLSNVDMRMRATFGEHYGLVVETAPGAGTKVVMRVPRFAPRAHPNDNVAL
ncbi:signal transduction histidine kinase [Flexivirga endophytica]|uniref:Signal transduction histidine kinase n=1 Tax=Flexivirga endophytica TaxID=1849103 RepID=A0A916SYD1_9MICO|nr:signal transduction histidine kinase [Flexivirga endophytica]GHB35725.1 signal transduction histidine kinase [Flexivirga endophytica]